MKKYLLASVLVLLLAAILAMPLAAAEKESVKIKLPDGIYMYDSSVRQLQDGSLWVGFRKYFVVYNKNIYSPGEAVKKIGVSKLNKLFTENKKYKILFGGEQIGEIYSVIIEDGEEWNYKQNLFTKDIKQGPAYVANQYLRTGSATMCLAVPEEYKEIPKKVYATLPQEEVDKIAKLAKEKLLPLVISRKEVKQYHIKETELAEEQLIILDKIYDSNGDLYLGIYRYIFKNAEGVIRDFRIVFNVRRDKVYVITSQYDDDTLFDQLVEIFGILDFDRDGEEELFMEKMYLTEDGGSITMEIYKQKSVGNWILIKKIKD